MRVIETRVFKQKDGTYNIYFNGELVASNVYEMTKDQVFWHTHYNECFRRYYTMCNGEIIKTINYKTSKGVIFNLYQDTEVDEIYICFRGEL